MKARSTSNGFALQAFAWQMRTLFLNLELLIRDRQVWSSKCSCLQIYLDLAFNAIVLDFMECVRDYDLRF